jgi:hypothetical protein
MTSLHKRRRIAQADAEYEPMDMPAKDAPLWATNDIWRRQRNWWQSDLVSALCERNAHFRVTTQCGVWSRDSSHQSTIQSRVNVWRQTGTRQVRHWHSIW